MGATSGFDCIVIVLVIIVVFLFELECVSPVLFYS